MIMQGMAIAVAISGFGLTADTAKPNEIAVTISNSKMPMNSPKRSLFKSTIQYKIVPKIRPGIKLMGSSAKNFAKK